MPENVYVHRTATVIDAVFKLPQPGYATEKMAEDHADITAFRNKQAAIGTTQPRFLGLFTNASRPAADTCNVGDCIYNTDNNAPNYSDGTHWRDAIGTIT